MATSDFSVRLRSWTRVSGSKWQPTSAKASRAAVADTAPVDAEAPRFRTVGEPPRETDVFGDRHPFDETEVLVDERHLAATAAPDLVPVGLAIDQHLSAIGPEQAAEDLDERGLAGTVLAEERQDFAAMDVEAHTL